jgi:CubicO group peptidase (beta-lactamase class C family)
MRKEQSKFWRLLAIRLAKLGTMTGAIAVLAVASDRCFSGPRAHSASLNRSIDDLFAEWNKPDSPGCALAVIKEGKIIYKRGYGCANLEYGTPITPSTVFNIASASKQFTAMCVLLLAQQGKLSLDDDIRKYIPEVPEFGRVITIRHLVHHTSGLRNLEDLLPMAGWRMNGDVITREHMLDMVRHQKELNFNPGDEYLYCNTGYHLLAEIVGRVSGQSFAAFADANIFKPLGMTNTHFHDDFERIVRNRAFSYRPAGSVSFENAFGNASVVGGGGIYSTVEDLAKWLNNFDHGRVGGPGVLKQMHEKGVLNNGHTNHYAFGLFIDEYRGMEMVEHGGGAAGYTSDTIRFPDQKLAVVLLANLSAIDAVQLARQVASIVLFGAPEQPTGSQEPKSSPQPTTRVSRATLDAYCGVYELKPGILATVTREGDRLYAEATGAPKVELWPETENSFLIKEDGSRISFERDERGRSNRLILQRKTRDANSDMSTHVGQRIIPSDGPLRAEELTQFIGEYASDELRTTYAIFVRNGELFARHYRLGDIPLTQTPARDQFMGGDWLPYHVAFTRDARNQVTGFKLTAYRSRNVRFERRRDPVVPNTDQSR